MGSEMCIRDRGWPYDFDVFSNRYQSRYKKRGGYYKGVAIWIYVDNNKKFEGFVVQEVVTSL